MMGEMGSPKNASPADTTSQAPRGLKWRSSVWFVTFVVGWGTLHAVLFMPDAHGLRWNLQVL